MTFLDEIRKPKDPKARDRNIELAAKGEINLGTKTIKDKTKYTRKEKHKLGRTGSLGVDLFDDAIDNKVLSSLKTLANLDEGDIRFSNNGFNFTFERSLKCNYVRLVEKNNNVIVEFRNKQDDPINGKKDYLVYEKIIKPQEFKDVFENVSGIYLSYV